MSAEQQEILDRDTLQQLMDLDDGSIHLIQEMLVLFKEDTPPRLMMLEQAIRQADKEQVGDLAHAVKGAAGTMGAAKLKAIAQQLEVAGRQGAPIEFEARILDQLRLAFDESTDALDRYVAQQK